MMSHVPLKSVKPPQATFRVQQRAGRTKTLAGGSSFPTDLTPPPQLGRCTCNDMVGAASTTSREHRRHLDVASTPSALHRRRRRCMDHVVAGASTELRTGRWVSPEGGYPRQCFGSACPLLNPKSSLGRLPAFGRDVAHHSSAFSCLRLLWRRCRPRIAPGLLVCSSDLGLISTSGLSTKSLSGSSGCGIFKFG